VNFDSFFVKISSLRLYLPVSLISISLTSFFADVTYEGARAVLGIYLGILGASALIVGSLNIGELIGYIMRFMSGYVISKKRDIELFWILIYLGYILNLVVIPLLALTNNYLIAFLLAIMERIGKGIRVPLRDYLIAEISTNIGKGKGFGFHEFFDSLGATIGPGIVALILAIYYGNYFLAFLSLALPAALSLIFLRITQIKTPILSISIKTNGASLKLEKPIWIYTISMCVLTLSLIPWPIASYHLKFSSSFTDYNISLFYLIIMLTTSLCSMPLGLFYDRFKFYTTLPIPFISLLSTYLFISFNDFYMIIFASILWGIVLCFNEVVMRAILADLTTDINRVYAFGTFSLFIGFASFISGLMYGFLYEVSIILLIYLSFFSSILSLAIFYILLKNTKR